jgi:uncharacterized protein
MLRDSLWYACRVRDTIRRYLAEQPDCIAVWLFGSSARGTARSDSDVDVAVLVARPPNGTLADLHLDWAADLSRALGREVDLVVLNRAPVDLVYRVLAEDGLLFERDRSARIAFEVRARNAYYDLLPHLRRYRRQDVRA